MKHQALVLGLAFSGALWACGEGGQRGASPERPEQPDGSDGSDGSADSDGSDGSDDSKNDGGDGQAPELTATENIEPGAACPMGGVIERRGRDVDGDGVLSASEIEQEERQCSGGQPAGKPLSRLSELAPSDRCPRGGRSHAFGFDTNADGELDDDEVVYRQDACGGVIEGDVTLTSPEDASALAGIVAIDGKLSLHRDGGKPWDAELPDLLLVGEGIEVGLGVGGTVVFDRLQSVGGSVVTLGADQRQLVLARFSAPSLKYVAGDLQALASDLSLPAIRVVTQKLSVDTEAAEFALPALVHVDMLDIGRNVTNVSVPVLQAARWVFFQTFLHSISMPALSRVEALEISMIPSEPATTVSFPALNTVGSLDVYGDGSVPMLSFPALRKARSIDIKITTTLATLELPELTEAEYLLVSACEKLAKFEAPKLASLSGGVSVAKNPVLESLELGALRSVGGTFRIDDNPALSHCKVEALLANLSEPPTTVTVSGNDDTGTCEP